MTKPNVAGVRVRRRQSAYVHEVAIGQLVVSPLNPRRSMDEAALDDLAASLRAHGQLQPLLVRPKAGDGETFEIVCGHRRHAAAKVAGLSRIVCTVREMTDAEAVEAMLAENSKRADVPPLDESFALRQLVEWGESPKALADRLGRTSKWVRDRLALSHLVDELRALLEDGTIGLGSAVRLAQVGRDDQRAMAETIPGMWSKTTAAIQREIERRGRHLEDALWDLDAGTPGLPACTGCPARTDGQGDLFDQANGARCLSRGCWDAKTEAWLDEQRAAGADVREERVDYTHTQNASDPVWWLGDDWAETPAAELLPDPKPIIYFNHGVVSVRLRFDAIEEALAEHEDPEIAAAARKRRADREEALARAGDSLPTGYKPPPPPPKRKDLLHAMGLLVEAEVDRAGWADSIDRKLLVPMVAAQLDAAWAETRRAICQRREWDKDALEQLRHGDHVPVETFLGDLDNGQLWGLMVEVAFHRSMDYTRHTSAFDENVRLQALDRAGVPRPPHTGAPAAGETA